MVTKIKVKELYSLKKGETYWITIGDKDNPITEQEMYETRKLLNEITRETGIIFILANHKLKLLEKK